MEENLYHSDEGLGIQWLDYVPTLWKYRWAVGAVFLASVLYGVIPLLFLSPVYEATATVIRLGGGDGVNLLSLLAQQAGISRGGSSTGKGDNVLSVLRSRTMAEKIAREMGLEKHYGVSRFQDAAAILKGQARFIPSKEGTIEIKVTDKFPQKAAEIANFYAENLNRLIDSFGSGLVSRQRLFITERLKETESTLRKAEEALKDFQEKNRTVVVSAQAGEALGAAAALRGQLIATEIQLQQMRSFATESNPEVVRLKRMIAEYKRQMSQAQYGDGLDLPPTSQNPGRSQKDIYLPAAKVPGTLLEITRLTRDVKIQETVNSMLTEQLEQTKLSEVQDTTVVQPLDPALPPEAPKPVKIGQTAVIYGSLGIFAGVLIVLIFDYTTCNWLEIKSHVLNAIHPSIGK